MPSIQEKDQVGKREALADLITNVQVLATPASSMVQKRRKPNQKIIQYQTKTYADTGHAGVPDGQDATNFVHEPRKLLLAICQKSWNNPAVSDFAEETVIAGERRGEMSAQIRDSIVQVKRIIERRMLSAQDQKLDDGQGVANETRGAYSWLANVAQGQFPVPDGFRTPVDSRFTAALSTLSEETFLKLHESAYKERKGPAHLYGFVGVELKRRLTRFSIFVDTPDGAGEVSVQQLYSKQQDKQIIRVIDRLVLDTGSVDLHLSSFMQTDVDTGVPTDSTHRSGIFIDMSMWGLAYVRLPRIIRLPYLGGGHKAIVDTIFASMCDNPLGHLVVDTATA